MHLADIKKRMSVDNKKMSSLSKERGGVLALSAFMFLGVLICVVFAIEIFRLSSATSQQHDSAQFAAESALATLRNCMIPFERVNGFHDAEARFCYERAKLVAEAVIDPNRLIGGHRAQRIDSPFQLEFYNCGSTPACVAPRQTCTVVNSYNLYSRAKTTAARVKLKSQEMPLMTRLFNSGPISIGLGDGVARYAPAKSGSRVSRLNYESIAILTTCH